MRVAAADYGLLRRRDVLSRDGLAVVEAMYLLDALAGQRVDQPGLSPAELHDLIQHARGERLPRRLGVLRVERGDLVGGEVSQHHVLGDDVERANLPQRLAVGAYLRLVVAYVQHADKRDGRGEWDVVAVYVAVPQLAKEGNKHVAGKAVRLVEKNDKRLDYAAAELGQHLGHGRHGTVRT